MGSYRQAVFPVQADVKDDDVGRFYGIGSIERLGAVEAMHIQAQSGQAQDQFFAEILIVIDKINEGRGFNPAFLASLCDHPRVPYAFS